MKSNNKKNDLITAEVLCIGSELLLGNIINSNSQWIASELANLGIPHFRQTVIGDNFSRLKEVIIEISKRSQILITTGGLGPTPDDLTTETIASAFSTQLEERAEVIDDIRKKLNQKSVTEKSIRKQALVPIGADLIANKHGTAPGIIWSPNPNFTILTFPGVPKELKQMWKSQAINWLKSNRLTNQTILSKSLNFTGIGESELAEEIKHLLKYENPTVAPYASLEKVTLRITARAESKSQAQKLLEPIEKELQNKFGTKLYGKNNESINSLIVSILKRKKQTLSIAESCTGGGIGASITCIPGSSEIFRGGIIAYSNTIKNELLQVPQQTLLNYGAVSKQTVEAMAQNVLEQFKSNWSIAVSGIAGPNGGTKEKPVGCVHFCIAGPIGIYSWSENFGSHRSREDIQKLSVLKGLDQLRLFLLSQS